MTGREPGRGAATAAPHSPDTPWPDTVLLAVVAAHRRGQPLHGELLALGARYERDAVTAPVYRMIALAGAGVARGGIVAARTGGASVEVELHRLPVAAVGALLCALPAPLAVGRVELVGGSALGIVCVSEPVDAVDISEHGSWPAYLATRDDRNPGSTLELDELGDHVELRPAGREVRIDRSGERPVARTAADAPRLTAADVRDLSDRQHR